MSFEMSIEMTVTDKLENGPENEEIVQPESLFESEIVKKSH